jgi:hypothetical protein
LLAFWTEFAGPVGGQGETEVALFMEAYFCRGTRFLSQYTNYVQVQPWLQMNSEENRVPDSEYFSPSSSPASHLRAASGSLWRLWLCFGKVTLAPHQNLPFSRPSLPLRRRTASNRSRPRGTSLASPLEETCPG